MKKLLVVAMLAVVVTAAPAFALDALRAVQGTVEDVDLYGRTLRLVNGMTFAVPTNISIVSLKAGEQVTVAYQDGKDGRPELGAFWIDAGPGGDSSDN